jgi:hypothetical protein
MNQYQDLEGANTTCSKQTYSIHFFIVTIVF